jgi:hypothetical protein
LLGLDQFAVVLAPDQVNVAAAAGAADWMHPARPMARR